jgi:hypothetical protein
MPETVLTSKQALNEAWKTASPKSKPRSSYGSSQLISTGFGESPRVPVPSLLSPITSYLN